MAYNASDIRRKNCDESFPPDVADDRRGSPNRGEPTHRIAHLLQPLAAEYDTVFLDCPPSISLVSENVLHATDILVVPLIPTTLSVRTLDQLTEFVAGLNGHRPQIRAFFSMVDRRKRLHREITTDLWAQRPDVAQTAIPALSLIERMSIERAPVTAFAPRSQAAHAYQSLWSELRPRPVIPDPAAPAGLPNVSLYPERSVVPPPRPVRVPGCPQSKKSRVPGAPIDFAATGAPNAVEVPLARSCGARVPQAPEEPAVGVRPVVEMTVLPRSAGYGGGFSR